MNFAVHAPFQPSGDQPEAINQLVTGVENNQRNQVLLGVTGSGKTHTVARVIEKIQKPTLVISHNKTLAAQLYQEFRDFFPENAVSYFVSYYDYYQPEAYIPTTDTYIEKETQINDDIDKLRLAATTNLLTRKDVIVVASVSAIYNLGSPVEYAKNRLELMQGEVVPRSSILMQLTNLQYQRNDMEFKRGTFRIKGENIQIWPAYEDKAISLTMFGNAIEALDIIDPLTGDILQPENPQKQKRVTIFPAKHYIANTQNQEQIFSEIQKELNDHLKKLRDAGKMLEAYRIEQRVNYDIDMIREVGFVNGVENYSRYFDGRQPGDPPFTLIDHFEENAREFGDGSFLTVIDESHITVPQIRGMYNGDRSRKQTLVDYGFRLPSALDNRPLKFDEFLRKVDKTLFVSATPNDWEKSFSDHVVVEQLIRPTGLLDPEIEIIPSKGQVARLVKEILLRKQHKERVLVTTLTKNMAETLTEYLNDQKKMLDHAKELGLEDVELPKVQYLHADVETLERSEILDDLRRGVFDVVVGINLLREGLDLPEVSLVAILDADKEGFLRSATSLIQIMGRAARHQSGKVIMFADSITGSMKLAIDEVTRRRIIQEEYNKEHGITPTTISKPIREQMVVRDKGVGEEYGVKKENEKKRKYMIRVNKKEAFDLYAIDPADLTPADKNKMLRALQKQMNQEAKVMNFEKAAEIRDVIEKLGTS